MFDTMFWEVLTEQHTLFQVVLAMLDHILSFFFADTGVDWDDGHPIVTDWNKIDLFMGSDFPQFY